MVCFMKKEDMCDIAYTEDEFFYSEFIDKQQVIAV